MNNVQIMSTSPQAGTAKTVTKSSSVSKTAKSSGFDDVLQKSQAQAQDPKAAAQDAKDAAKETAGSAADETEASAAAAAAEKNPAATKTKAKGKDAKQGTKNAADTKEAVSDDSTDVLAEAAQAAVDAKLVLAQAVAGNDVQVQDLTATDVAAETAGTVENLAQALLDASSSQQNAQAALQSILPQDASKGQAQKTMLAMLAGQNLAQEAAPSAMAEQQGGQAQALQTQAAQAQKNDAIQQLLAQMTPSSQADAQTAQQPLADLQNLSTLNTNVQQMPQVQAQAATATPLMFQSAATTSQTEAPTAKASDFANLLGTNVTSTSVDDLTLTQQVVAAPQNSGSSLGDFLKGSSQQPGQAMTEMLQTSDGTESVTQLPEEAAFDKAPTMQEAVPTQAGITSFAQTLQNIDGTQQAQTAQAAQQPQTDYDVPQQIVDQARLIQRGQDTEMVIHLKPEHLGDLTLRVSVGVDGAVNASFHSNNAEVRTIIENTLVQLKQDLNDQGIKVDNVGVYAGLADGGRPQDSGQQGWQQGSSQGQQHSTRESAEAFEDEQELAAALATQKEENAATDGVDYRV